METGKDCEILTTNLQPFFWRKIKNIIRQNKKGALLEFLFGLKSGRDYNSIGSTPFSDTTLEETIKNLQNQVDSLQQKVIDLETVRNKSSHGTSFRKIENLNYPRSGLLEGLESTKSIQQVEKHVFPYTLKDKKGSYLTQNDSTINHQVREVGEINLEILSEDDNRPSDKNSEPKQYNISSTQNQAQNAQALAPSERSEQQNFITLSQIPEPEKIEIIKLGFQLQAEGKRSLKKYYESTDPNSLFQLKGYSIKYEGIRKSKLYKQLKIGWEAD